MQHGMIILICLYLDAYCIFGNKTSNGRDMVWDQDNVG